MKTIFDVNYQSSCLSYLFITSKQYNSLLTIQEWYPVYCHLVRLCLHLGLVFGTIYCIYYITIIWKKYKIIFIWQRLHVLSHIIPNFNNFAYHSHNFQVFNARDWLAVKMIEKMYTTLGYTLLFFSRTPNWKYDGNLKLCLNVWHDKKNTPTIRTTIYSVRLIFISVCICYRHLLYSQVLTIITILQKQHA